MAYLLRPPTVDEGPIGGHRLFYFYDQPRGISLLVTGTEVVEQRWPDQDMMRAADVTYLGGHEYVITDEAAQIILDSEYADCVTPVDAYVDTYEAEY